MSLPQTTLPPVVLADGPSTETDHHRQRRVQRLTDASIALLLLLTLGIVFVTDCRSPGGDALHAHNASSERLLFDPLREPIAEVRQNPQRTGVDRGLWRQPRNRSWPSAADWTGFPGTSRWTAIGVPTPCTPSPTAAARRATSAPTAASEHRVALTGLAVLAFQAGGNYDFNDAEYSECVRCGLDWLVAAPAA